MFLKKFNKRNYSKDIKPIPLFYKKIEALKEIKYPPLVIVKKNTKKKIKKKKIFLSNQIHGLMGNFRNFSTFYSNKLVKENRN